MQDYFSVQEEKFVIILQVQQFQQKILNQYPNQQKNELKVYNNLISSIKV